MTDHPTRRRVLATIASAAAVAPMAALPALADDADTDAALFAYEPRLLAAQAAVLAALDVQRDGDERHFAGKADDAARHAAEQASSAAHDAFSAIAEAALATRTRTLAGIAFKLRLCNACGGDTVAEALLDDLEAMGLPIELFD
jgi:hypothetical protein